MTHDNVACDLDDEPVFDRARRVRDVENRHLYDIFDDDPEQRLRRLKYRPFVRHPRHDDR